MSISENLIGAITARHLAVPIPFYRLQHSLETQINV